MAILKAANSKATPHKALAYVLDPVKLETWNCQNLDACWDGNSDHLAYQFMETQHLYDKGYDTLERKYYHYKMAFHPDDRIENGGPLTPEMAEEVAAKFAAKHWPDREVVWAIHGDGETRHIHFVVNAVSIMTGKKLDVKDAMWRQWKDDCQDLCREYGLQEIDWRKATHEKRMRERESEDPEKETFAEKGLRERGEYVWKDELRRRIDEALSISCSMEEFRDVLRSYGVELTRCTAQTISYKMGVHKACRGDTLGGDYTMAAISHALQHNLQKPDQKDIPLDDRIAMINGGADVGRVITEDEHRLLLKLGQLAGIKRSTVDEMCDMAAVATWPEKQEYWSMCQGIRNSWWDNWQKRNQAVSDALSEAYRRQKEIKKYEWLLSPRNRRASLASVIFAAIFLSRNGDLLVSEKEIAQLRKQQEDLRKEAAAFKVKSDVAVATLRKKGLTRDEYLSAIQSLQKRSESRMRDFSAMTMEERAQFVMDQAVRNAAYSQGRNAPDSR